MMRRTRDLGRCRARRQDLELAINLHGVGIDQRAVELLGERQGQPRFAARGRAGDHEHGAPVHRRMPHRARLPSGRVVTTMPAMQNVLVLIAAPRLQALDDSMVASAREAMRAAGARIAAPRWLALGEAAELPFDGERASALRAVAYDLVGRPVDVAVLEAATRRKRLLIADMDSTIVENETLDELADQAGVRARVA